MKALQVFSLFTLPIFCALIQQPAYGGINQRSWCAAPAYCAPPPEEAKDITFISPQTCSSVGNGQHCPELPWKLSFSSLEISSKLNFGWSPYLEVNVTFNHKLTTFDHQNIVILEDDPVVVESASFLFEKHPSESTLLSYQNGTLHVISGSEVHLTKKSRVVLVGHGSKGPDGMSRLGGYTPEDLAKVVSAMVIVEGHVQTLSLVGCYLGGNPQFAEKLLRELTGLNVQTEVHFWRSAVSVNPAGEKLTMDDGVWRRRDGSKKVIAWLDERGTLQTRVERGNRGEIINDYRGRPLFLQTLEWPTHPQMFVPADLRKKYTSIDCLEGLTWSLFFEEHDKRRAADFTPAQDLSPVWLGDGQPKEGAWIKHITSILDLVLEIRYHAREDEGGDTYYVLNNFVFKVQKRTFYTSLVGKYMNLNNQQEVQTFLATFEAQEERYTVAELRQDLKPYEFNKFCRQTFHAKQCEDSCGQWSRFFMEAVFAASIRNFRTFSLFLMSVIACEVSSSRGSDNSICSAFVGDHYPMMRQDPWPFYGRRGFYGCTQDANEKPVKRERVYWLDEVVSKENYLYTISKQMMSGVDHDQETELDIFGKVKVMNKYAFTSYLQFFRGTIEGKKLSRGCIGPSPYDPYE